MNRHDLIWRLRTAIFCFCIPGLATAWAEDPSHGEPNSHLAIQREQLTDTAYRLGAARIAQIRIDPAARQALHLELSDLRKILQQKHGALAETQNQLRQKTQQISLLQKTNGDYFKMRAAAQAIHELEARQKQDIFARDTLKQEIQTLEQQLQFLESGMNLATSSHEIKSFEKQVERNLDELAQMDQAGLFSDSKKNTKDLVKQKLLWLARQSATLMKMMIRSTPGTTEHRELMELLIINQAGVAQVLASPFTELMQAKSNPQPWRRWAPLAGGPILGTLFYLLLRDLPHYKTDAATIGFMFGVFSTLTLNLYSRSPTGETPIANLLLEHKWIHQIRLKWRVSRLMKFYLSELQRELPQDLKTQYEKSDTAEAFAALESLIIREMTRARIRIEATEGELPPSCEEALEPTFRSPRP